MAYSCLPLLRSFCRIEVPRYDRRSRSAAFARARDLLLARKAPGATFADFDGVQAAAKVSIVLEEPRAEPPSYLTSDPETLESIPHRLPEAYELIKTLGGVRNPIHLVRRRASSKLFIIKQVSLRHENDWPDESTLLEYLIHPNIISIESVHRDHNGPSSIANIVLPYCSGGDMAELLSHLSRTGKPMPVQFVQHVASSLLDALLYLHRGETYNPPTDSITRQEPHQTILHRDIKPANILVHQPTLTHNSLPQILLADFDLSTPERLCSNLAGTDGYMSPSVAQAFSHPASTIPQMSPADDYFSFGVTLYQLITSGKPYDYQTTTSSQMMMQDIARCTSANEPEILNLMLECLDSDPQKRPLGKAGKDSLKLHRISAKLKKGLQKWCESGGRLPEEIWAGPLRFAEEGGEKERELTRRLR
ncbi:hypothetical protein CERZMDRAFT_87594 [Cercospora zeae-maydis SCOH1-5]|uniref:Protein kinase domain-containing protein n=1 Tax=Cercospora zeae-maydis SCOH1-5 TaxID=717836 RepID=A0A6A6F5D3_9PEZI|nr:hypothetical protein CERZMDRAFT_87594 [Cercospora zeae-maydis SCOH1-5]